MLGAQMGVMAFWLPSMTLYKSEPFAPNVKGWRVPSNTLIFRDDLSRFVLAFALGMI
jgi:hypothetical protein